MIRPQAKSSPLLPRLIAVTVTGALLVGVQSGLAGLALPAMASGRDMIRELDPLMFERFAAPAPPESDPNEEEEVTPDVAPEEPAAVSFEQEVGMAVEQLEELFGDDSPTPTDVEDPRAGPEGIGLEADVPTDRFESLFGSGDDVAVGVRRDRPSGRGGSDGVGIGIRETSVGGDPGIGSGSSSGPDVSVQTGNERSDEESDVVIEEFEPEAFDGSEADRLGQWMRANPAPLPIGVRVHVNYEPTFLTSTASFVSEGRSWELYLMFNESLRELHLVLVDGDRSVYLIDRGFQERSRSLREGTVRRQGGEIMSVDSQTGAASGDRAQEFYNVFLSWWEATKG